MGRFGRKRSRKETTETPAARTRIIVHQGRGHVGISTIVHWLEHGREQTEGEKLRLKGEDIEYDGLRRRGVDDETTYKGFNVYHPHPGYGRCFLRPVVQDFFPVAAALVHVVDSEVCKDSDFMEWTKTRLERLRRDPKLDGAVIVVIVNKQDLPDARSAEEVEEIINKGEEKKIKVFPTVATKGEGVTECFDWVVGEIEKLNAPAQNADAVTEPWKETVKDVKKDGMAGLELLKAAGKTLMSKVRNVSSRVA